VSHPEWLANPVLVRKKNGKWRMCVVYTGLNKACPKVPFPLPQIDQIVDSTAGCETLSFLDAYSGYHQIKMKESDQFATSFITPFGMYCYVTMPFGLTNVGATYQRCMTQVFGDHIGWTVEAYVDDIVVKTRKVEDLVDDLRIAFKCHREKDIKLNPEKCVFGVPRGMLLGFIVSERGIEANLEKGLSHNQHRTNQRPQGSIEGHGMPCGLEPLHLAPRRKRLASVPTLEKIRAFFLDPRGRRSPRQTQKLFTNPPVLMPPTRDEALLLYIAATTQVVSAAVVVERQEEGHALSTQRHVYFISEVLSETKTRYPHIQKLVYTVVLARRKLHHYFESHPVTVVSSFPLGEIVHNQEASGRIAKWAVELMGETLTFVPRKAIKSQVLADFVAEWTDTQLPPAQV
jgi:hypothetical protein